MRPIKFRAWNNYIDEMIHWDELLDDHYGKLDCFSDPVLEFMQYTGLKDKNGREIYEGDEYHLGDPNITYTVVWQDTALIGKQNGSSSYAGLSSWQERIEIIGNVYEGRSQ